MCQSCQNPNIALSGQHSASQAVVYRFRFASRVLPHTVRGLRGHMTATHHLWKAQGKRFFIMLVIGAYKTRRESSDM